MSRIAFAMFLSAALGAAGLGAAQQPADVQTHIEAARKLAGSQWSSAVDLFCATEQQVADMRILPSANAGNAEGLVAEPMKVFDNLYFVGTKTDANWTITTPEGIILIDSGRPQRFEDTLIAGFQKLGLNPADIRYVLIAHEHEDHFGGSRFLQERYPKVRVGMSAAGWKGLEQPQRGGQPQDGPKRDLVLQEGVPITLGGVSVTPVAIPGHTPGSMGFIFPVTDNGAAHVAAVFGGTVLNPTRTIPFDQYLQSIGHWGEWTKKRMVDVGMQNHPIMDRTFERLAELKARKAGQQHPFIVGEASYQRLVGAMSECARAQLARRAPK
jgi:metallo-beta-lactamase class B